MRKILLSMMCMAAVTTTLTARTLSPDEALQRASVNGSGMSTIALGSLPTLVETRSTLGLPVYYVFNLGNEGFKILSADDCGAPVLGFSDTGSFDPANVPPGLQYMLDMYAEEIAAAATSPAPEEGVASAIRVERQSIQPLVTTKWNQDAPYYNMTPTVNGQHTVTGCTATAFAQVMNYHKWPAKGQGSITYNAAKLNQDLTLDFSTITFEWDKMLDSYTGPATEEQKNAVATLMKAAGYAVRMNYGINDSGAYSQYAAVSVWKYFGYDKGAAIYYRDMYGINEWEQMIYDNIRDCGPVLYSGFTNPLPGESAGGHSFVCDGYDGASGLFHFNWGWGGSSDGYFALTGLDPSNQGIGGSNSGYNAGQIVVLGIRPPFDNEVQELIMGYTSPLEGEALNEDTRCGFNIYWVGMLSAQESADVTLGARLVYPNGRDEYLKAGKFTFKNETWWNARGYGWYLNNLADGVYRVYPVFSEDDGSTWKPCVYPVGTPQYFMATKTANTVKIAYPPQADVQAEIGSVSPLYTGMPFELKANITNSTSYEYFRSVRALIIKDDKMVGSSDFVLADVLPGETKEYTISGTLKDVAAGTYDIVMVNEKDQRISESVPVTVKEATAPTLRYVSGNLVTSLGNQGTYPLVYAKEFKANATVECTSGVYVGRIYCYVYNETGSSVGGLSSSTVYIESGSSVTVEISGELNLEPGRRYAAYFFSFYNNNWNQLMYGLNFIAAEHGGIEAVEVSTPSVVNDPASRTVTVTGAGLISVNVYNVSGALVATPVELSSDRAVVNTGALAPGVYFVKVKSASGTVTEKIIR